MSKLNIGKHYSEITIQKLRDSHRGQIAWNKGIPCSEETKRKIGEANKGRRFEEIED